MPELKDLIPMLASIGAAAIAAWAAYKANQQKAEFDRSANERKAELDRMANVQKAELDRTARRQVLATEQQIKDSQALQAAIDALQKMRDAFRRLLATAGNDTLNSEEMVEELTTARIAILEAYRALLTRYSQSELSKFHAMRNVATEVYDVIVAAVRGHNYIPAFDGDTRRMLEDAREDMSDCLDELRDRSRQIVLEITTVEVR